MVGHPEQDRVHALLDEAADDVRLGLLEHEHVGHGGERPAAVRVGRMGEIVHQKPQLRVAARLVHEPVEEGGEAVHGRRPSDVTVVLSGQGGRSGSASPSSPYPRRCSGRALMPIVPHQWTSASSWPWVTQTSPAPVSRIGAAQVVPVRMVRDDEGKFDALLARPRPHPHPAGGEAGDGIGEAAGPEVLDGGGRADHDGAGELAPVSGGDLRRVAERNALAPVELGEPFHGAVQVDGPIEALLAQQRHHALRLAERIGADDVRALRKERHGGEELAHLGPGVRVAEDRQTEGRLRDEHVAGHDFVGRAGRVLGPLVVARNDEPRAAGLDGDLRRAEHVAGGGEAHHRVAEPHRLAEPRLLGPSREIAAVAHGHDPQGLPRRQHAPGGRSGHGRNGRG